MNASRPNVATLCVQLFDRIQTHRRKEEQLLALAAAFVLMCGVLKIKAQDAFVAVKNLMAEPLGPDGLTPQFSAMKFHLESELAP